jgi:putative zinc finger/helix-turn-helix YgiT family protein
MKILKSERKLCLNCMEEHDVETVEIIEKDTFKEVEVEYPATYEFCPNTNEYLETEEMIRTNSLNMKDAYRKKIGLLTSEDIKSIREKYGISQKDFSEILDWGGATITRYENHQVQDRAHDDILRMISGHPELLLEMLNRAQGRISPKAYEKYFIEVNKEFGKCKNQYLIQSIHAIYANLKDGLFTGNMNLCLDKVVEVINYLSQKVNSLHKVKLMKMLWYSDALNFKRHGKSITGLAYSVLKMGAVPKGYEEIMILDGVSYDVVIYDDVAYKFKPTPGFEIKKLSAEEIASIDKIIDVFGDLNTDQIVARMHEEDAYKYTSSNGIISYSFAEQLSIE